MYSIEICYDLQKLINRNTCTDCSVEVDLLFERQQKQMNLLFTGIKPQMAK